MIARFCWLLPGLILLTAATMATGPRPEPTALSFDGIPDAPAGGNAPLARYLDAREAAPLGWSNQGRLLIRTRFGDVDQLHLIDHAQGARRQVTFGADPPTAAAFSPDPARDAFFFLADTDGDERYQLYYQRTALPTAQRLTDGVSVNGSPVWSTAGHEIAFFSTVRDGVSHDIYVVDPESGTLPRLACAGDAADWYPLDFSADDRQLLVLKSVSMTESHLYLVDLENGQRRELDAAATPGAITTARLSRDGQGAFYLSDRDGEFRQLRFINFFSGQKLSLSAASAGDVEEFALSRDGHYLAFVSNEAGFDRLNLIDLAAHQDATPPRLPGRGVIGSLSFDAAGNRLAFSFAAPNHPRDAYVLELASGQVSAWTESEAGPVDLAKFVLPRAVRFPTFDRQAGRAREIPAWVFEPAGPGQHPVYIAIESGPDEAFRPGFDPLIQYLVNEQGFAVVVPNVRGSAGYGKSFLALGTGRLREDAVKDIGALLVWVRAQPSFDSKHVSIGGRGYGGYLALAALANYGDRLQGGIANAAISDFLGLLQAAPPDEQAGKRAEFGDERDPEMRAYLRHISPLTNVERIAKPLLIAHGSHDRQVPAEESMQLVNRLRSRGVPVWYLRAADAGHDFLRKHDRDAWVRTFAQFLAELR